MDPSIPNNRVISVSRIKRLPYPLALAFACAWMIDVSLAVPQEMSELVPFSQYPHLLILAGAFCVLAVARRRIEPFLHDKAFLLVASIFCCAAFVSVAALRAAAGSVSFAISMVCSCVIALYQASMLILCLKTLAGLPMVDCVLTLIVWQLFVALLRAASTVVPGVVISCLAPLAVFLCFAWKGMSNLAAPSTHAGAPVERPDSPLRSMWFPIRLMLINALVIFTIQALQGFSPEPVAGISYIGSLIAIAISTVVLAVSKRVVRMRQLYNVSLVVLELSVIVFAVGTELSYRIASVLLDAAYLAFSAFFFTVLCNTCQRNGRDSLLIFSLAYLFEQIAAFFGEATAVAIGPGVHALPLVLIAGLGAMAFTCLSTEEDYQTAWNTALKKPKFTDPATYYYSLADICTSIAMQYSLSKRESDVLLLLAQKKTATQISEDLVVSIATVKTHTHNIYKKIGIHSRQELLDLISSGNSA